MRKKPLGKLSESRTLEHRMQGLRPGPWDPEPDEVPFFYKGYQCRAKRNMSAYHWCGYVYIPLTTSLATYFDEADSWMHVHGGVTYNQLEFDSSSPRVATHKVLGFDCGHHSDWNRYSYHKGTYRTLGYVIKQIKSMVIQIIDARRTK